MHTPKEKRQKWDPKAEKGIFVGYGETTKGYRVYFPRRGTIEIKRDVIFTRSEGKDNSKEEKKRLMHLLDSVTSIQTEEESELETQPEESIGDETEDEH